MAANFCEMRIDGSKTRNEVVAEFVSAQEQDCYDNGHSYSGGIGMARGLKFGGKTFDTYDAAYDWLEDNAVKWEEALCVTVKEGDQPAFWLIGAWCAS